VRASQPGATGRAELCAAAPEPAPMVSCDAVFAGEVDMIYVLGRWVRGRDCRAGVGGVHIK
jgi:hypothetical protein